MNAAFYSAVGFVSKDRHTGYISAFPRQEEQASLSYWLVRILFGAMPVPSG